MTYIKRVFKIVRRIINGDFSYLNRLFYLKYYKTLKIKEKDVLIEPQQGRTINGNMFYIMKELATNGQYSDYNIYVAIKPETISSAERILSKKNIKNVKIVKYLSREYYRLLAASKYLITDTSFLPFFIKKEGQVILNTWHGTPLKCLGKKVKIGYHNIGNVQKNFIISDYLLYPNEYTKEHMIEDYMLENISNSKVIISGYPRNTVFLDDDSREAIRKELNLNSKEILVYMPTWREGKTKEEIEENVNIITNNLKKLEESLADNQILYVNLHPLDKKGVDFKKFNKIKQFPEEYETYEFLNIADCLITDYSSVFFDFAITKRKIILFTYDEEDYLRVRGLYFDFNKLPFTKVRNIEELVKAINDNKQYDEEKFIKEFCSYDSKETTSKICETVILNKKNDLLIQDIKNNGKENILIYTGNLAKNGITSSLRNLLYNIDTNEKNYYVTFSSNKIDKNCEQLLTFPENVKFIATTGLTNMTVLEKISFILYKKDLMPLKIFEKVIDRVYTDEVKRLYGKAKFDTVIQFCGYEFKKILLYSKFESNTVIYVHSDMDNEIKTRNIQHRKTLEYAYNNYDKVVVVNKDLTEATAAISNKESNIYVANNIINYEDVLEKAKITNVEFDEDTESNVTLERLNEILDSDSKKFITIGRFSPEKGHERLIKAFNRLYKEEKNIYLIIIGGAGKIYDETVELIEKTQARENIIAIKSLSNPYTVLNKSDCFVFSSYYEGFGLVIAEADILNKPIISTDVVGPRSFVLENKGTLVSNDEDGLYNGMKRMLNNEIMPMNVDYKKYNENAIEEFYRIFEKNK